MAKPTNPLLSLQAHGTLADALTYQRTPLANIARTKPSPTDPRTLAQVYQRWDYQDAAWYWATLTPAQKAAYKPQATRLRLPLFAYFLRYYLRNLPDLAGRWRLDEGTGTIAHDSSKNTNHGTIYGATWTKLPSGLWVLSFDGVDNYVNAGSGASTDLTSNMTISLWFKPSRQPTTDLTSMILVSRGTWSEGGYSFWYYYFAAPYGSMRFITHQAVGYTNIMNNLPSSIVNSWQHFVATFANGTATLYLNGVQLGTTATLTNADPVPTRAALIGKRYSPVSPYISEGLIADVRIYNRALQAAQILAHAQRRYPQQ